MARIQCINDDCQDEAGPFVRTPDGPLCEECWDAQDEDCE
jgi:hypothetical protein